MKNVEGKAVLPSRARTSRIMFSFISSLCELLACHHSEVYFYASKLNGQFESKFAKVAKKVIMNINSIRYNTLVKQMASGSTMKIPDYLLLYMSDVQVFQLQ